MSAIAFFKGEPGPAREITLSAGYSAHLPVHFVPLRVKGRPPEERDMWVCFNDGFVSAVQDRERPRGLVVRARNRRHLAHIFPGYEVVMSPDADYACRLFIHKTEFAEILSDRIAEIDYSNFKASVKDRRLHRLYADFWYLHAEYQLVTFKQGGR